jgi:hypothetical protein
MKSNPVLRALLPALILFFATTTLFAQAPASGAAPNSGRVALVIGNGAYSANALRNPPNDADDVVAALKDSGFEVSLVKDANLEAMEKAVSNFAAKLKGADTGLFYYAGHGVAVDGMNYLIPVSPRIDDAASVKARAVAVDVVVGKMEATGVRTALVFLDSCRDNPFPGASRSGNRGLAVVAAPKTVNSLIAYATSPGDVAQDGSGRNGVFSGAVIKQLREPGLELNVMMRNVKSEVASVTGNKQNPRVDDGMKEPFFFISMEALSARADAAFAKSKAELAELERQFAELQTQIKATKDSAARQALEVEQQRQQALQAAKKLEAENLAREAERQRQAAVAAEQISFQKKTAAQATQQEQGALADLAATRRAKLDKLARDGASDNPDVLIETVERLEAVLREVDGQYAAALQKSLAAANGGWDKQLASMSGEVPDITETDADFAARVARQKTDLESKRQAELSGLKRSAESQRLSQTASIRKQYDETLTTLQTKVWTLRGSAVSLSIGTFDRNARIWPFTVDSRDPTIPIFPVNFVAELGKTADPVAAIRSLDAAVKANALTAELDWGITRDVAQSAANSRYGVDIRAVRVISLTTGAAVVEAKPAQRAAYFAAGKRSTPIQAGVGSLVVVTKAGSGEADVYLDGKKVGTTPLTLKLAVGLVNLQVRWADAYSSFAQQVTIGEGRATTVNATKTVLKVGDTGPAGGIIFYDKGRASEGWRYLEAAPSDQSTGIQWYNGSYITTGATATGIGSGKANTATILSK